MYPSSNNMNIAPFFGNYHMNDNNHSNTPQEFYDAPSSSFLLHPSPTYIPLEDEAVFCEFFQQQQFDDHNNHMNTITNLDQQEMPNNYIEEYSNNDGLIATNDGDVELENSSQRKTLIYKRDRHSKIDTARGPRDRRMRLSLDVAKKLFGLQDLLGFDKASKTVDWLLTKSRSAILELLADRRSGSGGGGFMDVSMNSASSTSECEVISGTGTAYGLMTGDDDQATNNKAKSCCGISCKKQKEKVARVRKCVDFHHPLAKASRERARERARVRTTEKRNNHHHEDVGAQDSKSRHQAVDQVVNQLGSKWSTFQENQHQSQMSSDFHLINQGFVCDHSSLLMTGNWTPSYYGVNFPLEINVTKAWEGYNK